MSISCQKLSISARLVPLPVVSRVTAPATTAARPNERPIHIRARLGWRRLPSAVGSGCSSSPAGASPTGASGSGSRSTEAAPGLPDAMPPRIRRL
jgi:hypothetical protein